MSESTLMLSRIGTLVWLCTTTSVHDSGNYGKRSSDFRRGGPKSEAYNLKQKKKSKTPHIQEHSYCTRTSTILVVTYKLR